MALHGNPMRKLFNSLRMPGLGSEDDHPLANPREAQPIFAELRTRDSVKALEEISDWLQSIIAVESFKMERRFEVIRQLDDAIQPHRIKLAREYGAASSKPRPQEVKLWAIGRDLWANVAGAYDNLIGRIERKEKGFDGLRRESALIAVRAARANCLRVKLQYVRYGPITDDIWSCLARAYRFAESRGIQHTRLTPYADFPGETSPEEEFLRAHLLSASAPDALPPAELELAERLIAGMASRFRITHAPNPDSTYWLDLANPRQPLRLAAPPAQLTTGLRFFATAAGYADVQNLLARLEKTGELPRGLGLGVGAEPDAVITVLKHLRLNWAPRPPVRRSERRRTEAGISVTHGFEPIVGLFRPSDIDLDFGTSGEMETWAIENMSGGGFGAAAHSTKGDWLRIGALLAVRPDAGGARWDIAIIRRLARDDAAPRATAHVGAEVVSRDVLFGEFTTNIGRWGHGVAKVDGLVIPEAGEAGAILVLLQHGLYLPGEQLLAMIAGRRHLLFPVALVERGEDYDLIKFRAMVQEA